MKVVAWYSTRLREVCVNLDPDTARRLVAHLEQVKVLGGFLPPATVAVLAALNGAVRELPPGGTA